MVKIERNARKHNFWPCSPNFKHNFVEKKKEEQEEEELVPVKDEDGYA
jgi:hypothetical protein